MPSVYLHMGDDVTAVRCCRHMTALIFQATSRIVQDNAYCVSNPTWRMVELAICYFHMITIIIIRVSTSNRLAAELASTRRQHSSKGDCVVRRIHRKSGVSGYTYVEPSYALRGGTLSWRFDQAVATVSWMTLRQYEADIPVLTTDFAPKHRLNTSRRPWKSEF